MSIPSNTESPSLAPRLFDLESVEKPFHYVRYVSFPQAAVPIAVKTLHGSTCNDICRVTTQRPPQTLTSRAPACDGVTPSPSLSSSSSASSPSPLPTASPSQTADYFLKSSRGVKRGEILLEAGGLALLHCAGLPVPPVLCAGEIDGTAFLMEPFIDTKKATVPRCHLTRDEAAAGRALARLHRRRSRDGRFGCRRVAASLNTGDVEAPAALVNAFRAPSSTPCTAISSPITGTTPATEAKANAGFVTETDGGMTFPLAEASLAAAAEAYTSTFVWSTSWPKLYVQHLLQPQVRRAQQRGLWSAAREKMFALFAERFTAHFATRAALEEEEESTKCASPMDDTPNDGDEKRRNFQPEPKDEAEEETEATTVRSTAPASTASDTCRARSATFPACSLLHGDIWGGNLMFDADGHPLFIDPQPLYGDREMDIAMTQFFGGFGPQFYEAYEAEYPLDEEADMRVPWYQLYYALMHLNLFGEAYGRAVEEALQSV